jgi:bisphosphoglycerate-dependent phosphoglycerate mutase
MSSPFQKKFCGKTPDPIKMLGDLNKDGKMSSYEQTRQAAIEANTPTNYNSPLDQKKSPGNVGYYDLEFEAHPSEKLPTRQENKAELDAAQFGLSQGKKARKDMTKMKSGPEKTAKAKEAYDLSKPYFDADAKMREQKRKDYKTILKAGATIAKNM